MIVTPRQATNTVGKSERDATKFLKKIGVMTNCTITHNETKSQVH